MLSVFVMTMLAWAITGMLGVVAVHAGATPVQAGSPPPEAVAELMTLAAAATVGVIGITKLVLAPPAKPSATVHVTSWPTAAQPAGNVPIVKPVGIVSVITVTAVVAMVLVLVNCSVKLAGAPMTNGDVLAVLVSVSLGVEVFAKVQVKSSPATAVITKDVPLPEGV